MNQEKNTPSREDKKILKACISKLSESIRDKIKREIRSCFRDKETMAQLTATQEEMMTLSFKKIFAMMERRMNKMVSTLEKIQEASDTAKETLYNVLLAIQQNEYLQAWYPAQQGYPEMKVVGQHPLRTARKMREKEQKK